MKDIILNKFRKIVTKSNKNISKDELDKIMYGLEGLYLTIQKMIIVFLIAFLLKILKEVIIFIILYNLIRYLAFGVHAKNSLFCLIYSIIAFIGIPLLTKYISINFYIKISLFIVSILLIIIYSPADTINRPIISKKRRILYKILSSTLSTIYMIISLNIDNSYISNLILFALLLETIMILPITYKLLKMPYNNYKTFKNDG